MLTATRIALCFALAMVLTFNMEPPWDVLAVILVVGLIATHRYEVQKEERRRRDQEVLPPM